MEVSVTLHEMDEPSWVKDAVFYQIFPDRFARGRRTGDSGAWSLKPWGSPPEEQGFQGGDLWGVVEKLDYLQRLGINALYFNPIFASAANHRYHTYDYYRVDPLLGGRPALHELLKQAHERGMRVILDGVFNHTGRGFWPFHHLLENGADSPYRDWFTVYNWPLKAYPVDKREKTNYKSWWGLPALPELNQANPAVQEYLLDVARHWTEFGIDGWRLDVADEIGHDFWRRFRKTVKAVNPEAYICGEIWGPAQGWLEGDQFDGVMNYPFMSGALGFFGADTLRTDYHKPLLDLKPLTAKAFGDKIDKMFEWYGQAINRRLLNLLDSHDTGRALWIMGEDQKALRLAVIFQMTMPGAPCIYYGDEIGLSSGDDPYCRQAFPWDRQEDWDLDLLDFYRRAIQLRHDHPVFCRGDFTKLYAHRKVYIFSRTFGGQTAVVAFNAGTGPAQATLTLPQAPNGRWYRVWPPDTTTAWESATDRLVLSLGPQSAQVLVNFR